MEKTAFLVLKAKKNKTNKTGLNQVKNEFERMVHTMKKEDFVKLGLDEDTAKKCADASGKELEGFIPKLRFDEVNNDKKRLELDLRDRDGQLEILKNSTDNPETLKQTIATLQADNKAKDEKHAAEIKQLKVDAAIDAALSGAKAKNAKAVRALLEIDSEKIKVKEDGTLDGLMLAEQIKKLQSAEDSKFLFETESKHTKIKGASPAETGVESPDSKVDTSKMSYEELCAYMEQNPEAVV